MKNRIMITKKQIYSIKDFKINNKMSNIILRKFSKVIKLISKSFKILKIQLKLLLMGIW